ncbi:MAG: indoleamine 2,3-dioxygenase [Cellvibrionaceae bacterium]|jgi:indoleamine 2,3-dioxygenase
MINKQFIRGFLPDQDPLIHLPEACAEWEAFSADLRKLVLTRHLRNQVHDLPDFPLEALTTEPELWRAANLFAYLTSLYVLGSHNEHVQTVPAKLAVPFHAIATQLGVPPILSYALQGLVNWRRIDLNGPIVAENLTLLQNFMGGMDEEWFVTLHTQIEASAAPAVLCLKSLQLAMKSEDYETAETHLTTIGDTLQTMYDILGRMQERCDPYIYFNRVRPFMFGWKDNEMFPEGVLYEGVAAYENRPVRLRGETGAQSSIVPAIDAALGIQHQRDEMRVYLIEMFDYMPPSDRNLIYELQQGLNVREAIIGLGAAGANLREAYNYAVEKLGQFRIRHIEYAALYILKPAKTTEGVGTGGTPFTFYLKKHIEETKRHRL